MEGLEAALCSPAWPGTHYTAWAVFELFVILLPQSDSGTVGLSNWWQFDFLTGLFALWVDNRGDINLVLYENSVAARVSSM